MQLELLGFLDFQRLVKFALQPANALIFLFHCSLVFEYSRFPLRALLRQRLQMQLVLADRAFQRFERIIVTRELDKTFLEPLDLAVLAVKLLLYLVQLVILLRLVLITVLLLQIVVSYDQFHLRL